MSKKIKQLIHEREGLTVEFKHCENELTNGVFETVTAFSNRYGGFIILGIDDNGSIYGVNLQNILNVKYFLMQKKKILIFYV